MTDDRVDRPLLEALRTIQARGPIGVASLDEAVAHSDRFVALIPDRAESLVDLGSGGGLPGLVIAWRRRDLTVTLVERRASRADQLRRAISALVLSRASVLATDVADLARTGQTFDVVTARSFAGVVPTLGAVDALLAGDGVGLISEPPDDRSGAWARALADHPALADGGVDQGIRRLLRVVCST
jgi:hypothetical protein